MKKLFYILIFALCLFGSCHFAHAQTGEEIANQRLDQTLELLKSRDKEIADLKVVIKELESSKLTPCSIALTSFKTEYLKLEMPADDNSKIKNKEVIKQRKQFYNLWKKSIQAQCQWQKDSSILNELVKALPFGAVFLKLFL